MLMFDSLDNSNSIYAIIAFMVINTFLCLYFINRYFEQKKINSRLQSLQDNLPEKAIKDYLLDQFDKTKILKLRTVDNYNISHDIANMRMAYLRIELNALSHSIDSSAYWQHLIKHLTNLFKILSPLTSKEVSPKNKVLEQVKSIRGRLEGISKSCKGSSCPATRDKLAKNMDVFYKKLESTSLSEEKLKQYQKKLDFIAKTFESAELRAPHLIKKSRHEHSSKKHNALDKISQHCEDNSATIHYVRTTTSTESIPPEVLEKLSTYEQENDRLTRYVCRLKEQLESLHLTELDRDQSDDAVNAKSELELDDEIIASNEQEITRLRNVVKSQRNAILDLEELANTSNHADTEDHQKYNMEIEQLKRSSAESEMCVNMLEDELENLKTSFANNREPTQALSADDLKQLNNEVTTLKNELIKVEAQNNQYTSLLSFVFDALSASSVEDITLLLHESLTDLKYSPLVLAKSADRVIQLFDNNTLSVREQTIISSLQLNEINPKKNGQLMFRLTNLSGLLNPYADLDNPQEIHDHIIQILKLSDNVISQILLTQKNKSSAKQVSSAASEVKELSYEVDEMLEQFLKVTKSIVNDSFHQIKSTARAKGLNATQISSFQAIEQDVLSQITAEDTIRPKIRKKFLGLINAPQKQ